MRKAEEREVAKVGGNVDDNEDKTRGSCTAHTHTHTQKIEESNKTPTV